MDAQTPPHQPWIRRVALGFAREARRVLRKLLNLDSDRNAIEAAIIRMDRRLEDFSGPSGRVATLERRVHTLGDVIARSDASFAATTQTLAQNLTQLREEQRMGQLAAIEQIDAAQTLLAQRISQAREALGALDRRMLTLSETLAGADGDMHQTLAALRDALDRRMLALTETLAGADGDMHQTLAALRAALEGAVVEQRVSQAAAIEQIDAAQTLLAQRLTQTRDVLIARLADVRDETAARLAIEVDGLRANLPGASAEHAALLEEALSDARALEPAFKELVARMRFLEKAACHAPVYSQPGMNAIIYAGAWNELPIAVPSTHVGVLAAYHGSGAYTVERGVRALIRRELKADHVALDIGAHVGLHAVVMGAIVKTEGALFCFEPDPDLAGALMQTFIMNGLTRHGAIVNAAVADRDGTHAFHRTLHSPESSLFGAGHSPTRDVVEVETIRLDGYFQPGARVDFAKIDAEGAEPSIIRGMARVLADNPGLRMVMEFAPEHIKRAGEEPGAFHDALVTHGFAIEMIDEGGGVAPISRDKLLSDVTHNIWLTPKRQA